MDGSRLSTRNIAMYLQPPICCVSTRSWHLLPAFFLLLASINTMGSQFLDRVSAQESSGPGAPIHRIIESENLPLIRTLEAYCYDCHGPSVQEANLRLDTLSLFSEDIEHEFGKTPSTRQVRSVATKLESVIQALQSETMPPEDGEALPDESRQLLIDELKQHLVKMLSNLRTSGTVSRSRRLTGEEYNYSMQAIFGVDSRFNDLLPPDPISEAGYQNDRELLGLSSIRFEAYLDSARRAIDRYVQFGKLDQHAIRYHIELEDLFYASAKRYDSRAKAPQPVDYETFIERRRANLSSQPSYTDPLSPKLPGAFSNDEKLRPALPKLHQQYVALPARLALGELTIRIRAAGSIGSNGRYPRMRVEAGITLGDGCSIDKRVLGEVDVMASVDAPETYEFRIRLEDVPTKGAIEQEDAFDRLSLFDMDQIFISNVSSDSNAIFDLGRGGYSSSDQGSKKIAGALREMSQSGVNFLHLDCLEVEMVPGYGPKSENYRWRAEDPNDRIAEELLTTFMKTAFRRPVDSREVRRKLELFDQMRQDGYDFRQAMRESLASVLVSPSFLILDSPSSLHELNNGRLTAPHTTDTHQLASRLSYCLWLSAPDERLLSLADSGMLSDREVWLAETQRMIEDPRIGRFLDSFCSQWLRLDKLENINVDRDRYSTYDADLKSASIRETLAFFAEVFHSERSALDLIDSDYALLNDRLSDHYGIHGVNHGRLQRVSLPPDSVHGGLLTHASILTMNSDGVDSHPIRRGTWLLDRILNAPPPPPPPNVPQIDEDDPSFAGLTLKERIELHRAPGACNDCHRKIDPWGIAFEHFDATGHWRTEIRNDNDVESNHSRKTVPIESSTSLPSGEEIESIIELKRYLRKHRSSDFADAITHHMVTYILGRELDYLDRPYVTQISGRFVDSDFSLQVLLQEIVGSELFLD